MLVISRREGEVIHVGDEITITVVLIDRGRVRLGIHAPKEIPIHRWERYIELNKEEESK